MSVPAEFQLAAAILMIYLIDCVSLLYVNEGIVERARGSWRILFGSTDPWIAGKRIALLNPFTPHAPAWRAVWRIRETLEVQTEMCDVVERLERNAAALRKLQSYQWGAFFLVLIALPLALSVRNTLGFLGVAALAWLMIWVLLIRLWFLRSDLELTIAGFALVAFECLVCPPNAANLIRKLSMRQAIDTDLVAIAGILFVDDREAVLAHIDRDVANRQILLDTDSAEYARTEKYRAALDLARGKFSEAQPEQNSA